MALTRVPNPMLTARQRVVTPYDYGVVIGSETSADNSAAINAMFAACAASYDASFRVYTLVPQFNGQRFRCDDEIWVGGTRAPGHLRPYHWRLACRRHRSRRGQRCIVKLPGSVR